MHSSTDTDSIAQIEELLGCQLPADYREWLGDQDSPNPAPARTIVQADPPYEECVAEIFSAHEVLRYVDMEKDMIAADSGDFPPGMIAIGDNGMGDYVLLSLRLSDCGSVHYLFHEESNPDDKLWGVYLLGDSFSGWLCSLTPDVEVSPGTEAKTLTVTSPIKISDSPPKPWWRFG